MKTQIFYGGWILTLLATSVAIYGTKGTSGKIWIALFFIFYATSTFFLLRNPIFPKRDAGLATSWMGPLLFAISMIVSAFYFSPISQALSDQANPTETSVTLQFNVLIAENFLGGCVNALLAYWMCFGYGLVSISALGVIIVPRNREKLENEIKKHPPRWGWIAVIISLLTGWLPAFFMIQSNKRFHQEMERNQIMLQKLHESRANCKHRKSAC